MKSAKYARRFYSSVTSKAAQFKKFGEPSQVLKQQEVKLNALGKGQLRVKMVAAPINPADLNIVEGRYGSLPDVLPAVGGGEGVGIIEEIGEGVEGFVLGQRVMPTVPASGTWQTQIVGEADAFMPAPEDIDIEYAATIGVNPCTAYRLLNDFVDLKEGDTIIQSGANSHVGLVVTQLARKKKLNIINLVRDRPDQKTIIEKLKVLGGDGSVVLPESVAKTHYLKKILSDIPAPKLGLNNTGGQQLRAINTAMGEDGVVVTYGGMSRQPIILPTGPMIFKNLTYKGFWYSKWLQSASVEERQSMINELAQLVKDKELVWFMETYKFSSEFEQAFTANDLPFKQRKVVFRLDQ